MSFSQRCHLSKKKDQYNWPIDPRPFQSRSHQTFFCKNGHSDSKVTLKRHEGTRTARTT